MSVSGGRTVQASLAAFVEGKRAVETSFSVDGAPAVVGKVLAGEIPRSRRSRTGHDYFVHGVGYTVVLPNGGEVHIDGSPDGDIFSVHDVMSYLETSGADSAPDHDVVSAELDRLVAAGMLRHAGRAKYFVS